MVGARFIERSRPSVRPSVYPSASLSTRKAHAHRLGRHRVGDELCGRSALQRDAGSSRWESRRRRLLLHHNVEVVVEVADGSWPACDSPNCETRSWTDKELKRGAVGPERLHGYAALHRRPQPGNTRSERKSPRRENLIIIIKNKKKLDHYIVGSGGKRRKDR